MGGKPTFWRFNKFSRTVKFSKKRKTHLYRQESYKRYTLISISLAQNFTLIRSYNICMFDLPFEPIKKKSGKAELFIYRRMMNFLEFTLLSTFLLHRKKVCLKTKYKRKYPGRTAWSTFSSLFITSLRRSHLSLSNANFSNYSTRSMTKKVWGL